MSHWPPSPAFVEALFELSGRGGGGWYSPAQVEEKMLYRNFSPLPPLPPLPPALPPLPPALPPLPPALPVVSLPPLPLLALAMLKE